MPGEVALDTSVAIQFLNGNEAIAERVKALSMVILPLPVVGELLFGAENSGRTLHNLSQYLKFIDTCKVVPMGLETARHYSQMRLSLKRKGKPIPENDLWIGAQTIENHWTLATFDRHFNFIDGITVVNWISQDS
ncbi:type II toxin-antitoxin system VapC family toxin [Romeria aff. gracilis LEGE 07310]|uniref:Type II toxin-antitoxin system VapC family toxin n=1 Tax=Vasconcelosia minhoensis LEGE 07310 TaxID=915328 RepID=A0A8J7DCH7_9CYAN|nr:type II toxin-antitoxin system VapC family toxin [Romeria gracilis]MBE9078907.1 type II toxin-antitoxin system VapC family toxin [Romeria aff. gracilis LEGE 07310]